jgi:hypothetical protein
MFKSLKMLGILSVVIFILIPISSFGDVPNIIKYSGTITDISGNLVEGTKTLRVRLYTAFSGGSQVWSDIFANVNIKSGAFNIILGSGTSLPDSLVREMYLQVEIQQGDDWEVMLPRVRVGGSVWADTTKNTTNTRSCPDDMVDAGLFCIDKAKSTSKMNFQEAIKYCAFQGKRLCNNEEMQNSCDHRLALGLHDMIAASDYLDYEFAGDKSKGAVTVIPNYLFVNYYLVGVDCTAVNEARVGFSDFLVYPLEVYESYGPWCDPDSFDVPGYCKLLAYARCCK